MILVDAGPLVALLHADDSQHHSCRVLFESLKEPMLTVWPAVTKAMYLLGFDWRGQEALWNLLSRGVVVLSPLDATDFPRMRELMSKYRDLPMDLADAALVRVAERDRLKRVFTLDRRGFSVYRPEGVEVFEIVP